ncbi:MAG: hypothetical protein ACUVTP_00750 [Candidatus Fervidibacter sp.]
MQQESAGSRAVWVLVLGIRGWSCSGIFAPFAWWLGAKEPKDIKMRLSP